MLKAKRGDWGGGRGIRKKVLHKFHSCSPPPGAVGSCEESIKRTGGGIWDHTKLCTELHPVLYHHWLHHWLFQIQCSVQSWAQCTTGGSLVHYSQGVRISNFQRFFTKPPPPPCISSFFLFIIAAPSVGEKIGNWVLDFCPHPLLPNFAGNGNFHILAEIENIKSSRGEYCLTASESICN